MSEVFWIEANPGVAAELPFEVGTSREALTELRAGADIAVLVIGATILEPVRLARRLRAFDDDVEILITCQPQQLDALQESLSVDPFVGTHTRAVTTDDDLEEEVSQALAAHASRHAYRDTISAAQTVIETGTPTLQRPSPLQYAATMWSESPTAALAVVLNSQHIVSANRAATELLERDELDLIGTRLQDVLPLPGDGGWSWLEDAEGQQTEHVVSKPQSGDGELHLEARVVQVDSPGEDVVLVFLHDVTERVRFEQVQQDYLAAEKRARDHAEKASRIREDVLATVSHDLRGPLQTLLTSSEILSSLAQSHQDASLAKVGETVERAAGYMSRLVGDLLDIARMEEGRFSLDCATVEVRRIIDEAVELTAGLAEDKGVHLQASVVPEGLTLRCDRTRVVQMLQNLLSNAVKFSPEGEAVTLDAEPRGDMLRFVVSDAGPGISAEEQSRLFERFWQADRGDKSGIGLGLAIVRGVVEAHDGTVSVDSAPGEGATFVVELPAGR